MKKQLAMILSIIMLLTLIAGCARTEVPAETPSEVTTEPQSEQAAADSEETQTEPEGETGEQAEEAPANTEDEPEKAAEAAEPITFETAPSGTVVLPIADEPTSFTIWTSASPSGIPVEGSPIIEYITEQTNVRPVLEEISGSAITEQFSLMIASGEYPDCIVAFADRYTGGAERGYDDEIIIDMTDLIHTYAPNYMTFIQSNALNEKDAYNDDHQMLSMYCFNDQYVLADTPIVRSDWLEELGVDKPETVSQLYDVLVQFRDVYKCSYPYMLGAAGQNGAAIVGAYGVSGYSGTTGSHFYQTDGVVHSSLLEDAYKDYLIEMNRWYSEKLVASDFYASASMGDTVTAAALNGDMGYWTGRADNIGTINRNAQSSPEYADFFADWSPFPTLEEGEDLHFYNGMGFSYATDRNISLSVQAEDPETIIKLFDFFYTREGSTMVCYGIEGVSFNFDEDGKPQYTELLTNNPDGFTYQQIALQYCWADVPCLIDRDRSFFSTYTQESIEAIEVQTAGTDGAYELPTYLSFTSDESDRYSRLISDIETYADESVVRFIIGEYNFESDWDEFQSTLREMGLEEAVSLKQNALDRYNQR